MKKFRIVALLLVMCLASSCFVGGTFAKYSSSASSSDSAIVAKWSVKVNLEDIANKDGANEVIEFGLFDTVCHTGTTSDDANVRDRAAANDPAIIAPGTTGKAAFEITNASDVSVLAGVTFTVTSDVIETTQLPIVFALDSEFNTPVALAADGTATISSGNLNLGYASNTTETVTLYWKWAFEGGNDNLFGTAASLPDITVAASISANQVD